MKILLFPLLLSAITSISPEARFQVYQELHAKHPYQVILSKIPVFKESEDSITLPLKSLDTKYVCTIPPPEEENPKEKPIKRRGKDVEQRKVDWALSKLQTMKGGCITSVKNDIFSFVTNNNRRNRIGHTNSAPLIILGSTILR